MSPSAPLLPLPAPPPQVRPGAITKKEKGGGVGAHTTFVTPLSCLSLKGTDQMASELLNVQQLLASLLYDTTHGAHLHSDKYFSFCTFATLSHFNSYGGACPTVASCVYVKPRLA